MTTIRSFIAIECPAKIKEEIQKIQQELKMVIDGLHGPPHINWTRPNGFHLTLKFLGNVAEDRLLKIVDAIRGGIASFPSFTVNVGGVGIFPNTQAPRVIWIGAKSVGDVLAQLQGGIEEVLNPLGFPREDRSFHPHLTLGRIKSGVARFDSRSLREVMAKWLVQNHQRECGQFEVSEILLVKSDLQAGGAVYTPLATMKLAVRKREAMV